MHVYRFKYCTWLSVVLGAVLDICTYYLDIWRIFIKLKLYMCTVLFNPVKFKAAKCKHKLLAYIIYTPSPSRLNEEILSYSCACFIWLNKKIWFDTEFIYDNVCSKTIYWFDWILCTTSPNLAILWGFFNTENEHCFKQTWIKLKINRKALFECDNINSWYETYSTYCNINEFIGYIYFIHILLLQILKNE